MNGLNRVIGPYPYPCPQSSDLQRFYRKFEKEKEPRDWENDRKFSSMGLRSDHHRHRRRRRSRLLRDAPRRTQLQGEGEREVKTIRNRIDEEGAANEGTRRFSIVVSALNFDLIRTLQLLIVA